MINSDFPAREAGCALGHILYPHQREAVIKLREQKSRLVADEMRVGKTATAIGLDAEIEKDGLRVVVCPKRALDVWRRWLRWLGQDVVVIDEMHRSAFDKELLFNKTTKERKWFVMHWDVLANMQPTLVRLKPVHVIADEVHKAKNRNAARTIALKKMKPEYRTGLTGTPCDKPDELWSILHWLWRKYYTSYKRFIDQYVDWYESTRGYRVICGVQPEVDELWEEMEPWFVRRRLADVAEHLPSVVREKQYVTLSLAQQELYDDLQWAGISWSPETGYVIPANPAEVRVRLQQASVATVAGDGKMREPSSKVGALMDMLSDMPGTPVVVFTQYRDVVSIVRDQCEQAGIECATVRGGDTKADQQIRRFQEGKAQVFCATIRAANEAIDLSRANILVMLDRDWAPGANDQAEARIQGLSSTHCTVIDLLAEGTLDDDRREKISKKREWIAQILGVRDEPVETH